LLTSWPMQLADKSRPWLLEKNALDTFAFIGEPAAMLRHA
jgi:hypothetical protein